MSESLGKRVSKKPVNFQIWQEGIDKHAPVSLRQQKRREKIKGKDKRQKLKDKKANAEQNQKESAQVGSILKATTFYFFLILIDLRFLDLQAQRKSRKIRKSLGKEAMLLTRKKVERNKLNVFPIS